MVLYEYPFNESIRTMLRLEHLFERLGQLVARNDVVDHHFALATLFEIMDVGARADLKSDLLKELERHRQHMQGFRGHPSISEAALADILNRLESAFNDLNQLPGKVGQALTNNEWLMSVRSRITIPGGTCEFDLPGYYAWQQMPTTKRRADLTAWIEGFGPLAAALKLLLGLLRDGGAAQRLLATAGVFQQSLAAGKTYQLLRVWIEGETELVPEITGHRLMVSVRFMKADAEGRLRNAGTDATFDMALCA